MCSGVEDRRVEVLELRCGLGKDRRVEWLEVRCLEYSGGA